MTENTNVRPGRWILASALISIVLSGCAPKSPEEKVAQLRSYYTARAVGFVVEAIPEEVAEPADMTEPGEGEDEEAMPEATDEAETMPEPVPVRQNVRLDILLQHDSPENLPGITLEVIMFGPSEAEKQRWKIWVETADLPKATGNQFTYLLEDVDFVEGDGFGAEVRHPIPPAERGDYKEFPAAGS